MKRTPLTRRTPLTASSSLSRRTVLSPVSRKRAGQNRAYTIQRRQFLEARPRCEFPAGCAFPATEVHHRAGRVGALLLDETHWSPLCSPHHRWTSEHPTAAVGMGISELRIGGEL